MHHILFYTPFKLSTWNNEVLRFSTHHILHASQTQKEQSMVFCDLVLIIFYTPLKLPIRLLTSLPCFVPIIFYTHLKLYNDNDIRRKSFIAISFHTHLKLPSTIPVAIRHFVPIIFYTPLKHMNNLLYNLFCTRHILHTSQTLGGVVISLLIVLYPSYSTHISNFHNMGHDNEMVLYPSYSTHISNV